MNLGISHRRTDGLAWLGLVSDPTEPLTLVIPATPQEKGKGRGTVMAPVRRPRTLRNKWSIHSRADDCQRMRAASLPGLSDLSDLSGLSDLVWSFQAGLLCLLSPTLACPATLPLSLSLSRQTSSVQFSSVQFRSRAMNPPSGGRTTAVATRKEPKEPP